MVCEEFSLCPAEIPLRSQGMLKVNLKKEGRLYRHSLHFIHYFQLDLFFPLYGVMKTCYVKYSSDCSRKNYFPSLIIYNMFPAQCAYLNVHVLQSGGVNM